MARPLRLQGRLAADSDDWGTCGAFLRREELQDGMTLSLIAVSTAMAGDRKFYVVGGRNWTSDFLSTLVLPSGMRALLYRNLEPPFRPAN